MAIKPMYWEVEIGWLDDSRVVWLRRWSFFCCLWERGTAGVTEGGVKGVEVWVMARAKAGKIKKRTPTPTVEKPKKLLTIRAQ